MYHTLQRHLSYTICATGVFVLVHMRFPECTVVEVLTYGIITQIDLHFVFIFQVTKELF